MIHSTCFFKASSDYLMPSWANILQDQLNKTRPFESQTGSDVKCVKMKYNSNLCIFRTFWFSDNVQEFTAPIWQNISWQKILIFYNQSHTYTDLLPSWCLLQNSFCSRFCFVLFVVAFDASDTQRVQFSSCFVVLCATNE